MNEKVLFNGKEKVHCKWKNFIATCNEIPDDEVDSPFWDRLLITHEVTRLTPSDMLTYYAKGGKTFTQKHDIHLPQEADILAISLNADKLKKVLDVCHSELSDRALSFLPTLVKNVMCVWQMTEDRALVKTTELLVGKTIAKELAKTLVPKEIREVYDIVDGIGQCISTDEYNKKYDQLELAYGKASAGGFVTEQDEVDLQKRIADEEAKLDFLKSDEDEADVLNQFN